MSTSQEPPCALESSADEIACAPRWTLHTWLARTRDGKGERVPFSLLGIQQNMLALAYKLPHSNLIAPASEMPAGQNAVERRTLALTMSRPMEHMNDQQLLEMQRLNLCVALALHRPGEQWTPDDKDGPAGMWFTLPLIEAFVSTVDIESYLREMTDSRRKIYSFANSAYARLGMTNWHPCFEPATSWNHVHQVQGANVRRRDNGFFERRLMRTEQLFTRLVEETADSEEGTLQKLRQDFRQKYAEYRARLEEQRAAALSAQKEALAAGKTPQDADFPQTPPEAPEEGQVLRRVLTKFVRTLLEQHTEDGGADAKGPQAELMREVRALWQPGQDDMDEREAGAYRTISHPMALLEIDIHREPPRLVPVDEIDQLPLYQTLDLHSMPVTHVQFPEGWLQLGVRTALERDEAVKNLLERVLFVSQASDSEERMVSRAGRDYLQRMQPLVYRGPSRLFWTAPKADPKQMRVHHLTTSFYVTPHDPTAPCSQELHLELHLDHPLLGGKATARLVLPWRHLAQEAGIAEPDQGLEFNIECLKNGGSTVALPHNPIVTGLVMDSGDEWKVKATAIPVFVALPIASHNMLDSASVVSALMEHAAPETATGSSSSTTSSADAELNDLTQMVAFNGLYVSVTFAPTIVTSDSILFRDPQILQAALKHAPTFDYGKFVNPSE